MIGSSAAGPFFEVVFALLVTELAIIGMLCVPVPGGLLRPVVRWVSTSSMLASLAKPLIWFGTLVGLSFLFTTPETLLKVLPMLLLLLQILPPQVTARDAPELAQFGTVAEIFSSHLQSAPCR